MTRPDKYRKDVALDDTRQYAYVNLGAIKNKPSSSYPFPTDKAADRFAAAHQKLDPDRVITVDYI